MIQANVFYRLAEAELDAAGGRGARQTRSEALHPSTESPHAFLLDMGNQHQRRRRSPGR